MFSFFFNIKRAKHALKKIRLNYIMEVTLLINIPVRDQQQGVCVPALKDLVCSSEVHTWM
jgi:hypothetical protein